MEKQELILRFTFTEPLLGTVPKDRAVYASYIASKAPKPAEAAEEECQSVQEAEESGWTGFHLDGAGNPFLFDYVIKGFFKDACSMLSRVEGSQSKKLRAFKKVIDGLLFPRPRQIPLDLSGPITLVERPLRAQTAQGERVALARSDAAPVGSSVKFGLVIMGSTPDALLTEWLDYGAVRGLGQWRNGGYGRFTWEQLP
jgi:hypothetical protein